MGWQPKTGKRKRGRQRRIWRDDRDRNRNEWRLHEEGYILHWKRKRGRQRRRWRDNIRVLWRNNMDQNSKKYK